MRIALLLLFFSILTMSCNQKRLNEKKDNNTDTTKRMENSELSEENDVRKRQIASLNYEFKSVEYHDLESKIIIDLNGDGIIDTAEFLKENNKGGIIITDGKTNEKFKIGLGNNFYGIGDNFDWVEYWGIVKDKSTGEILFNEKDGILGDTIVTLENPSIVVRKEFVGGGVITFKKGKYIWIHQSD